MEKIAVSSIAWQQGQELDVAKLLKGLEVSRVEVAPTKIWPEKVIHNPLSVTVKEVEIFKTFWREQGIKPVAMQSMLFLRPDLKIFESSKTEETVEYLKKFIVLSARLGVPRMVFGSPKNRVIDENLSSTEQTEIAIDIFSRLGNVAAENDVVFCIEPNPKDYGCNFVTNAEQGRNLVELVASPGFGLHLDAAGMTLAGDDVSQEIIASRHVLKHFHVSEPYLNPVVNNSLVNHQNIAQALAAIKYDQTISIEMKPSAENEQNIINIEVAIELARKFYSSP